MIFINSLFLFWKMIDWEDNVIDNRKFTIIPTVTLYTCKKDVIMYLCEKLSQLIIFLPLFVLLLLFIWLLWWLSINFNVILFKINVVLSMNIQTTTTTVQKMIWSHFSFNVVNFSTSWHTINNIVNIYMYMKIGYKNVNISI